jgi:hypothetical protein
MVAQPHPSKGIEAITTAPDTDWSGVLADRLRTTHSDELRALLGNLGERV